MRILHINKFLYRRGGAEGYMLDVAAAQQRDGHEVAFFGMDHPENTVGDFAACFPSRLELQPPPGTLTGRARGVGRMLWSVSAARGIEAVLDAFRPDVAHLHNIYHHLSPSILKPLARRRVPTVMTLHDYKLACPTYNFLDHGEVCEACLGGRFHQALWRRCQDGSVVRSGVLALELGLHTATRAYARVGLFLCPSHFLAAKMTQAGIFPDRMRQHPLFVDTNAIAAAGRPGRGVVYAGRLSAEKGADTLIDAVGELGGGYGCLEIAGDGPERARLARRAEDRAPGRVRFHGALAKTDLYALIRSAAALVLPSRCYENQPMSVLEAFACGVPVIGTDLGGTPELIEPDVDGTVVPPNDPGALAAALRRVLDDPARGFAMGRAARAKAEQQFSPERHLAGLEDVYSEVASGVR